MPHTILSYSDKLFTPSESFIPRAYHAFETVKPLFIGHDRKGPTPPGFEALELGAFHGGLGETGFKQLGLVGRELRETLAHFINDHYSVVKFMDSKFLICQPTLE